MRMYYFTLCFWREYDKLACSIFFCIAKHVVAYQQHSVSTSTIRTSGCTLVFVGISSQCSSCTKFRITLNVMLRRFEEAREEGMSNLSNRTNFRYLNTPQKVTKLREMNESLKFQQKSETFKISAE